MGPAGRAEDGVLVDSGKIQLVSLKVAPHLKTTGKMKPFLAPRHFPIRFGGHMNSQRSRVIFAW